MSEQAPPRICGWCGEKESGDFKWESTIGNYLHDKCFNQIWDYALRMKEMRETVFAGMEAFWGKKP